MPFLPNFTLNRLSFWIGFIAASLLWWLFFQLKPQIPVFKKYLKSKIQAIQEKQRAGIEAYLREYIHNNLQSKHILHSIVSLDAILIPPRLIAVPAQKEPGAPPHSQTAASQMLPYLPDWSEWLAEYPTARTHLLDLMNDPQRLVIIAEPGAGKTTTLIHSALMLTQKNTPNPSQELFPFFQHVLDWDLILKNPNQDPLVTFKQFFHENFPASVRNKKLSRFLESLLEQNRLLLLLDGYDELPQNHQEIISQFLKQLCVVLPDLRIVVSASPYAATGLIEMGFTPVGLAAWDQAMRNSLVEKFSTIWIDQIQNQELDTPLKPVLTNRWLQIQDRYLTPFEVSLLLWGAYSGRLSGRDLPQAIQAWLDQVDPQICPPAAIYAFAFEFIKNEKAAWTYEETSKFLSRFKGLETEKLEGNNSVDRQKSRKVKVNSVDRALDQWIAIGILIEHNNGFIRFCNPLVLGYFASKAIEQTPIALPVPAKQYSALRYYTASILGSLPGGESWLSEILQKDESPLFANTFVASRWLHLAPMTSSWRSAVMRKLLNFIHHDGLPFAIRARAAAALINANDPSAPALFTQLLNSDSPIVRQIAIISLGALKQEKSLNQLSKMQTDPDIPVQVSVCLALGTLSSAASIEQLVNSLMQGDEIVRQAAAEALSIKKPDGLEILKQAARYDDLLVRCAVISGLTELDDPEVDNLLENLSTEDAQWMVRKTATEALENKKASRHGVSANNLQIHEIPWLIKFASKQGQGIPAGEMPIELLLTALTKGTFDERVASLDLLKTLVSPPVLAMIKQTAAQTSGPLQDAAINALWQIYQN